MVVDGLSYLILLSLCIYHEQTIAYTDFADNLQSPFFVSIANTNILQTRFLGGFEEFCIFVTKYWHRGIGFRPLCVYFINIVRLQIFQIHSAYSQKVATYSPSKLLEGNSCFERV